MPKAPSTNPWVLVAGALFVFLAASSASAQNYHCPKCGRTLQFDPRYQDYRDSIIRRHQSGECVGSDGSSGSSSGGYTIFNALFDVLIANPLREASARERAAEERRTRIMEEFKRRRKAEEAQRVAADAQRNEKAHRNLTLGDQFGLRVRTEEAHELHLRPGGPSEELRDAPRERRRDVQRQPNSDELVLALWKAGNLQAAADACRALIAATSRDPEANAGHRLLLARILLDMGQEQAAIAELNKACEVFPNHPTLRILRAEALAKEGDFRGAEQELVEYLRLRPDNQSAARLLADMRERQRARPSPEAAPIPGQSAQDTTHGSEEAPRGAVTAPGSGAHAGPAGSSTRPDAQLLSVLDSPQAFDSSGRWRGALRFPVLSGRPQASPDVALPDSPRFRNDPQIAASLAEKRRADAKWSELRRELTAIEDKIARGEGNASQLQAGKTEKLEKIAAAKTESETARAKVEARVQVLIQVEPIDLTEEPEAGRGGKPEPTPAPSTAPPIPGMR